MIPVQLSRNMKSQRKPAHPTAAEAPLKPQQLTSQLQALHAMSAATAQPRDCHTDPVTHDPAEPLHLYYIFNAARPSTTTAALTMLESRLSTAPAALTLQIMDQHIHVSCWYHLWLSTVIHNIDSAPKPPPPAKMWCRRCRPSSSITNAVPTQQAMVPRRHRVTDATGHSTSPSQNR